MNNMPVLFSIFLIFFSCQQSVNQVDYASLVDKVNKIRLKGCECGRTKMPAVGKIKWNNKLYASALAHAEDMNYNNYFSHRSRKGEDAGTRIRKFNYDWEVVGENIAEGQVNFDEVLNDWLNSPSHCKMIMNPNILEMGVGRSGNYWVQHFGKRKTSR